MAMFVTEVLSEVLGIPSLGTAIAEMTLGVVFSKLSAASKRNPNDGRLMQLFKRRAQNDEDRAKWELRKELLIKSIDAFTLAIESIEHRMRCFGDKREQQTEPVEMFKRALAMLNTKNIVQLAIILFDGDERRAADLIENFRTAQFGFMECWRDSANIHFYYRIAALRMAFCCDIYLLLLIDKCLQQLKVEKYLSFILPKLAKCLRRRDGFRFKLCRFCQTQNEQDLKSLRLFVSDLLLFTDTKSRAIVEEASQQLLFDQQDKTLTKKDEDAVSKWLEHINHQVHMLFTREPMAMAVQIVKQVYRTQLESYNPFLFELEEGGTFAIKSWIPIKLRRLYGKLTDEHAFTIIKERLNGKKQNEEKQNEEKQNEEKQNEEKQNDKKHLAVITGVPGAGKTMLTQKIAFDYATSTEDYWKQYDIILMAEFRSTSDRQHDTIVDLALHGMEKMGVSARLCEFIRENVNRKCEEQATGKVLIILDGYDEAVSGQCRELDFILNTKSIQLKFHLIVTGRPTGALKRKEKELAVIKVIGFLPKDIEKYIKTHFKNHPRRTLAISSVAEQIEKNAVFKKLAKIPLMLAFICLVFKPPTDEEEGKVENEEMKNTKKEGDPTERLYESVVKWMILKRLQTSPDLLAELASHDGLFFGAQCNGMTGEHMKETADNWNSLEQIKRLGYTSLSLLINKKFKFDRRELYSVQPNMNINVFNKIGLIIGNAEGVSGKAERSFDDKATRGAAAVAVAAKQTEKYQFAHRTLQEYFASMFMSKWAEEYRKREKGLLPKTYNYAEVPAFFVKQLMTRRARQLNESAIEHLVNAKSINFNIKSDDERERVKQLRYANVVLNECQNIARVHINLNKKPVFVKDNKPIVLIFAPKQRDIQLVISDGIFFDKQSDGKFIDKQSNAILVATREKDGKDASDNHFNIAFNRCQFSCSQLMQFAAYVNANFEQFRRIKPNKFESTFRWFFQRLLSFANLKENQQTSTSHIQYKFQSPNSPSKKSRRRAKLRCIAANNGTVLSDPIAAKPIGKNSSKPKKVKRKRQKKAGLKFHVDGETISDIKNVDQLGKNLHRQYDGRLEIRSLTELSTTATAIFSIIQSFAYITSLDLRLPHPQIYNASIIESIEHLSELPNLRDIVLSFRKSYDKKPIDATNWSYINCILCKCPKIKSVHIWLNCNQIIEPIELRFLSVTHQVDVELHDGLFTENDANLISIDGPQRIDLAFYRKTYHLPRLRALAQYVDANAAKFVRIQFFNVENGKAMRELVTDPPSGRIAFRHKQKNKIGDKYYSSFYMQLKQVTDGLN